MSRKVTPQTATGLRDKTNEPENVVFSIQFAKNSTIDKSWLQNNNRMLSVNQKS